LKITIMSGKGGVGKTTLAVFLSTYYARKANNVILADLDVEEPNAGIFLQKTEIHSIDAVVYRPRWKEDLCIFCGKCQEYCKFNAIAALPNYVIVFQELCHSCYACSELCPTKALPMYPAKIGTIGTYHINDNFVFIEGRLDIGQEIASTLVKQTRDFAVQKAQEAQKDQEAQATMIVFDAPPGTACASREAMAKADAIILVTEPTPFGLHDMAMAYKLVKASGKPCAIVINKDTPGYDGIEEFAKSENVPILARIPYSADFAQAYSKGELLNSDDIYHDINIEKALQAIEAWVSKNTSGGLK